MVLVKRHRVKNLSALLTQKKISHLTTREPGGAPFSEMLRTVLLSEKASDITPETQALMMCAARREHVAKTIQPALEKGQWVLCDRFMDSTTVYQGYVQGIALEKIDALHDLTLGSLRPALTFILMLPPSIAHERATRKESNHFDEKPLSFFEQVSDGFQALIDQNPERFVAIDGAQEPLVVAASIQNFGRKSLALSPLLCFSHKRLVGFGMHFLY